jgi:CRP-like cAMP-binding protein
MDGIRATRPTLVPVTKNAVAESPVAKGSLTPATQTNVRATNDVHGKGSEHKDTMVVRSHSRHVPVARARVPQGVKKTARSHKRIEAVTDEDETPDTSPVPLHQLLVTKGSMGFGAGNDMEETMTSAAISGEHVRLLAETPLLRNVEGHVRDALLHRGVIQTLPEGELLFREGEPTKNVMVLVKGTAKSFFTAGNGRVAHTRWLFAPASTGASEAIAAIPHSNSLSLLEKSTIWTVSADDFRRAAATSSRLVENVLLETSVDLRESLALARSLLFDDTQARLAQLFMSLLDKRGLPGREGRMIPLALTQQDFAEALGVDLRSINRVMVDWFATNLVVKSEKRFCVRDMEKLEAIAFASKAK